MAKAKTRLSTKALFVQKGYGQVEPNHLSAPRKGEVYGQLPAHKDIDVLENGQFVHYDYAAGVCTLTGTAPLMMVYNEEQLYEDFQGRADWAMKKEDYAAIVFSAEPSDMPEGTTMVPRVMKISVGDIWTTNTIADATVAAGDVLKVNADGYLSKTGTSDLSVKVVKVYTMPDLQPGVKVQCITE